MDGPRDDGESNVDWIIGAVLLGLAVIAVVLILGWVVG